MLSVPGDVLVGAAASGQVRGRGDASRAMGLAASSSCLYLAGMALNDYADRDLDARERPERPIPSGRVTPQFALGLATGLTVAGAGIAVAADGLRALKVAVPLAGAVWAYDLALKPTGAAVAGMSACRALDVLMGAGAHGSTRALPSAAVVGAHIATVTAVSRHEVDGATPALGRAALKATLAVTGAAAGLALRRGRRPTRVAAALGLVGAYAATVGGAHAQAAADPSPERVRRAVGTGVLGLMPLEAGLAAGAGALAPAAGIALAWPLARTLARRRSVT